MRFSVFSSGGKAARAVAGLAVALCLVAFESQAEESRPSSGSTTSSTSVGSDSDTTPDFLSSSERRVNFPDMPGSMDSFIRRRPQTMSVPPPTYAPINPRTRRMLDNQSNWGFMTPDDIIQDYLSTDSALPDYGPDGRDRRSMSAVERYYDRQTRSRIATNSPAKNNNFSLDPFANSRSQDGFGTANLFNNPTLGGTASRQNNSLRPEALSDLLGLKNNPMSPDAIRERDAQQRQMEAFRQALNFQQPVVTPAGTPSIQPTAHNGVGRSASGMYVPAKTAFDPVAGTYNPSLAVAAPIAPISPTAPVAPGQALPNVSSQTSSRVAPSKPDFTLPQRRF